MHIPAYAHDEIRAAIPVELSQPQARGDHCYLCDTSFIDSGLERVAVRSAGGARLHACRICLTPLVAQARRRRHMEFAQETTQASAERATWAAKRGRHLNGLENVRRAAEAVVRLIEDGNLDSLQIAALSVSLESTHIWATTNEIEQMPLTGPSDTSLTQAEIALFFQMAEAREAIANRLVYHLINEAAPAEPELCEEFECLPGCSGRHDVDHIDCGPDAIFEDLEIHGIRVRKEDLARTERAQARPDPRKA